MRKKIIYFLKQAGLKEQEIKIYLSLLNFRNMTLQELVVKTKLNYMMVRRTIQSLFEHEIISIKPLNYKQDIFSAVSLQALVKKIGRKQKKLRRLELTLRNLDLILPFCNLDQEENGEEELIEIQEGLDAFRGEYLKLPDICKEEYLHIGSMVNYWKTAEISYEDPLERNFIHRRIRKGIYARVLDIFSKEAENFQKNDSKEKRTCILKESLPITKNYLALAETQASYFICDPQNPQVIIIRQPELLNLYRYNFSSMWSEK